MKGVGDGSAAGYLQEGLAAAAGELDGSAGCVDHLLTSIIRCRFWYRNVREPLAFFTSR
jgi:hypothetical protein